MGQMCSACGLVVPAVESLEARQLLADISGIVFNDLNADGVRQGGEAGLANRLVFVDQNNNGLPDAGERTATTSSQGAYRFAGLTAGRFTVRQVLPNQSEQTSPTGTTGSFYAGQPAGSGLKLNIVAGPRLAANQTAIATVRAAARQWERLFSDPVTINVDLELQKLGTDGVIGAAAVSHVTVPYNQVRDALVASSFPDEAFARQLPLASGLKFRAPADEMMPFHFDGNVRAARANLLALGFAPAELQGPRSEYKPGTTIDGSLFFNSEAGFDFNPNDGVAPGKIDFYSTVLHEIGHVLGFDSLVDRVDFVQPYDETAHTLTPSPMDLFRLKPGTGASAFASATRIWTTGQDVPVQVFYDGGRFDPAGLKVPGLARGDVPLSTGASSGDGGQASHWKDDQLAGRFIGAMDPTLDRTFAAPTATDVRALGLLGWDVRQPLAGRVVTISSATRSVSAQNFAVRAGDGDDQLFEARFLPLGKALTGQAINGSTDVDLFAVRGRKSEVFTIKAAGANGLDPAVRVFGSNGVELVATPKTAPRTTAGATATLSFTLPRDGTFYVGVSGKGNVAYNVVAGGGDRAGSAGGYTLTVANKTLDDDGTIGRAKALTLGKTISAAISPAYDVDIFKFTVTAGQRIGFDVDIPAGAPTDTYLRLFDSTGRELAWNDDAPAPGEGWTFESALAHTFNAAGTYYVAVSSTGNGNYNPMTGLGQTHGIEGQYTLTTTLLT